MERSVAELEAIVRNRICRVCSDRTMEGECGREEPGACALFRLFPQVAQAIQSVNSEDVRDYIAAIRANVCSVCTAADPSGTCEVREHVECSLDAYLLLVVDAVEEATGKSFNRSTLPAPGGGTTVQLGPQLNT